MKNLRLVRNEIGFTQKELAQLLGVSQQSYSDYENERTEPDLPTLSKIADVLNTSVDYLLGRTVELGGTVLPSPAPELPQDEQQLLALYRKMSHPQKIRVIAYSEGLLSTHTGVQTPKNLA